MAQWKRAGPITQRSEDQNLVLLKVFFQTIFFFHTLKKGFLYRTVESRFPEPPGETEIDCSRNQRKNKCSTEGRQTNFGSSHRKVRKFEVSRMRQRYNAV